MLELAIRAQRATFTLDVAFQARAQRLTVLVGENGAGKTTVLRALAGLTRPAAGHATLQGRALFDLSRDFWPAAERRPVTLQSPALPLFPHLDVRDNVDFGLKDLAPDHRSARLATALERFALASFAERRVDTLSTGERQRVAFARAWVREPALLLLDEPFSALDTTTRQSFRALLRTTLADRTGVTLLVSHDPGDALALADDVVVMEQGRVTQSGTLEHVLREPASRYVARFLGVNLYDGTPCGEPRDGTVPVRLVVPGGAPRPENAIIDLPTSLASGPVRLVLHPREVLLSADTPHASARNHLRGVVLEIAPEPPNGDTLRVTLASTPPITAQITRASAQALGLAVGVPVVATFKATAPEVTPRV